MKIIGIVAEYNPFHNGHLYQIEKIKEIYKDCLIIAIVSSSFSQRGEEIIIDKFTKTNILLENGIDIVIELPYAFATQSSDIFAKGSIELLHALKIDYLSFGSESCDIDNLVKIAKTQIDNNNFNEDVKINLKQGISYPNAIAQALKKYNIDSIKTPNDLLAVSYIKEILSNNYHINFLPIKRTSDYNDLVSNNLIISASNIRNKLKNNIDISSYVPKNTLLALKDYKYNDNYFKLLKYKIISTKDLTMFTDVSEGIDNKLKNEINNVNNIDELISSVKSKRYTYNKISRMLNHIFTSFTWEDAKNTKNEYIRILGLSKEGKKYISSIKNEINLPILTKYKKGYETLDYEIYITSLYSYIKETSLTDKEYKNHVIIH